MRNKLIIKWLSIAALMVGPGLCYNCKSKTKPYQPEYVQDTSRKNILLYGVPTQAFFILSEPFVKYINTRLKGARVQTVATTTFLGWVDKVEHGNFNFIVGNGLQALDGIRYGYTIVATAIDEAGYKGAILVNKDSSINKISDLRGRSVATVGRPALAGHMLPMVYLFKKGFNVNRDIRLQFCESFESTIMSIYLGKCSAGFTSTTGWTTFLQRRPEIASRVALKWVTQPITGTALLIRNDVDNNTALQLRNIILSMDSSQDGRNALAKLGYIKFVPADISSYEPVKSFLREYNALIVDQKR
jgi:phosphonate transport system substrate-binding protein